MAIYTFGTDFTKIRSSVGGITLTVPQLKGVIRQRVKPLSKYTSRSTLSRNRFASASSHFKTLSPIQKIQLASARSSYFYEFPPFPPYNILIQSLFPALNDARLNSSLPINLSTIPAVVFPNILLQVIQLSANPFNLQVGVQPADVFTDFSFRFYATKFSNTIRSSSFPQEYKLVKILNQNQAALVDLTPGYESRFNKIPDIAASDSYNYYINLVLQLIHIPTGQLKNYPFITGKAV